MKKSLFAFAVLFAVAVAASAQSAPTANTIYFENGTRIQIDSANYGTASGAGGYLGHTEAQAGASASGYVAQTPGAVAIKGDASGYGNAVGYNTVVGNASGSQTVGGWSDASIKGNAAAVDQHGYVQVAAVGDGGMYDAARNGVDFRVTGGTATDGAVKTTYAGGFEAAGTTAQVGIAGGATVAQAVTGSTYSDGTASVGAVTFTGGAPAGQTAADRYGNTGFTVNLSGSGFDPVK